MRMKIRFTLTLLVCSLLFGNVNAQGTCNPAGNIILYCNYDGGTLNIDIDVNMPDIRIGICSYEGVTVNITGAYVGNVAEVLYAGYNDVPGSMVTGVDPGLVTILTAPSVTYYDPDGYPYMICAYDCDTDYVPGGCNTVDQATYYFLDALDGNLRYSYLQYGVWSGTYHMSDGGNCCFDAGCTATLDAGQDLTICEGDTATLNVSGADTYTWVDGSGSAVACTPPCSSASVSPASTTTYIATGTTGDGCTGIDTVTVFVNPVPVPTISNDGDTLYAGGGGSYVWLLDGVPILGATGDTYIATETGDYAVQVTDVTGCSAVSGTVHIMVTGIDLQEVSLIHCFPNPASAYFILQGLPQNTAGLTLVIYDILGRQVYTEHEITPGKPVNISRLDNGMYSLHIFSEGRQFSGKLVILHE